MSVGILSATYGHEGWTLRKNEETRLDAFEMKGMRKILRVSLTAKKTNEWVLNKTGVKREQLDTVKARKLAYCGHTMRKQGSCLEKEIMQGTMPGARRRGRPHMAWMDNIKTWTGLSVEESTRMTRGQGQMQKVRPWCGQPSDRGRLKNRTEHRCLFWASVYMKFGFTGCNWPLFVSCLFAETSETPLPVERYKY